jgi:hypothetical protein
VIAEDEHQAEHRDADTGPERPQLDDRASAEHQRADGDERGRQEIAGVPDHGPETVAHPRSCAASLPPEVHERGKEEAHCGQPEPDQLRMLVAALLLRALAPLYARRCAWTQGALGAALRHAGLLRREGGES